MQPRGRCLLAVLAHPDDESFLAAGVISRLRLEGGRTILATATLGEEGNPGDPPLCSREELPQVRETELRRAASILGIDELFLLGYRDRHLSQAPVEKIGRQIIELIRRFRPDVILTFDPNGLNLHTDHIAIARFATEAVPAAADPRWLPEAGPAFQVPRLLWTPPLQIADWARGEELAAWPGVDFLIDVRPWRDKKAEALRAHRTQHRSIDRNIFHQPDCQARLNYEYFRQAFGPPLARRPATDIFEGL